jgi:hypothetical protein
MNYQLECWELIPKAITLSKTSGRHLEYLAMWVGLRFGDETDRRSFHAGLI